MTATRLRVKVVPGARQNTLAGWLGETLRVRVTAPPEKGKANAAVRKLVAAAAGVPVTAISIVRGQASPLKTLEIAGISASVLRERLSDPG